MHRADGGNTTPTRSSSRCARKVDRLARLARSARAFRPKLWLTSASFKLSGPFHTFFLLDFRCGRVFIRSNQRSHRSVGCLIVLRVVRFTAAMPGETWLSTCSSSSQILQRSSAKIGSTHRWIQNSLSKTGYGQPQCQGLGLISYSMFDLAGK